MLPELIGTKQLCERYGRSTRTLNLWQHEKGFPKPVMRGGHGSESKWRTSDIYAWEEKRVGYA